MPEKPPFDAWSLREAAEALLLVSAALDTGLLGALGHERHDAELAHSLGLDARAVSICLGALEELGVVERGPGGFRLTTFGRSRFVDAGSRRYVGRDLSLWRAGLPGWLFLDEVLRSGTCVPESSSPEFRERLYRSLDAKPRGRIERVVERVLARSPVPRPHVLDVGGGAGTYARGFLSKGCRVTLLDLAETIDHVREAHGLGRCRDLELVAGDFTAEVPAGPFEAILLADVVHDLSAAEAGALVIRLADVSVPSAVIGIADVVRGRSRRAGFFAVALLLYTRTGNTYEAAEIESWLADAGFVEPLTEDVDPDCALVTARLSKAVRRRTG